MRYNRDTCAVETSALSLCLLALRRGDLGSPPLTSGALPFDDKEMYYRLQSEAGAYYNPDVELSNTTTVAGIYFTVSTKADGVIRKGGKLTVDKIKCVKAKNFYKKPDELTLALLKCSAYFLCVREGLDAIDGRVSYYNVDTKKLKYFHYKFLLSDLKSFYAAMLVRVEYRIKLSVDRDSVALESARDAVFPYTELREGQETMVRECYSAMKRGKRIFVEAPTGTGKTISSLFPAVRALGNGYCDKIFYLTPKTATRREAFSAAARLHASGTMLRTVVISAKEQVCCCAAKTLGVKNCCNAGGCELAHGYYDRLDDALCEMLERYRGYSRSLIFEVAKKYRLCPYELSLDLSELCDIIICDYNYAFDPSVYLRRYFGAQGRGECEKYVFLIDEAHNLADRAREMYSAELHLSEIETLALEISNDALCVDVSEQLVRLISAFNGIKKLCKDNIIKDANGNDKGFYMGSEPIERISRLLDAFRKTTDEWVRANREHPASDRLSTFCSNIRKYLTVEEYFDGNFRFYAEIADGDVKIKLYCHDPSDIMNSLLTRAASTVMFSATLTPPEYFRDVLGGGRGAESLTLVSPFPKENLCVAVADYVNTRFDDREDNAGHFADLIMSSVRAKAGNYIAYFPSYQCLEQTYKAFGKKYPKVETVVQKKYMSAAQRDEFLSAFKEDTEHLRIGFCVLGGVFSEGVDLPGSRLIGSIIFGVGLPGLSSEKNIIKEHFDLKSEDGTGYDYAYTFPGMNNVLQAAGRVIRSVNDCVVVVLADDRYATPKYRALFPNHWQGVKYAKNASSVAEIIRRFWENDL